MALEMQMLHATDLKGLSGEFRMSQWFALIALLPLHFANAQALSEVQNWERTKLPPQFMAQFISNAKCNSGDLPLRSCRAAFRTAQALAGVTGSTDHAVEFERAISSLEIGIGSAMPLQMFRAKVINAHLNTFDAHAEIKPSLTMAQGLLRQEQNFVGIGVVLEPTGGGIHVNEVRDGSPAQKAGVKEDDLVVAIAKHGRDFEEIGADIEKASGLILGSVNTTVALRVSRGGALLDLAIRRAQVSVPFVSGGEVRSGVGYLRIHSFESYTVCPKVIKWLTSMQEAGMKKLILDLRGNPGGEKGMAVCVAELFLGARHVVGTKSVGNAIPSLYDVMQTEGTLTDSEKINWEGGYVAKPKYTGPMVVLVDAMSASGSEIVAGALQDYERAWLIGERTSGKGTVQSVEFVPDHPTLTMKYTIERFYQPSGRTNQGLGLTPSFEVPRRLGMDLSQVQRFRETDLFPRGLAPESTPWIETRPAQAAAVARCLELANSPGGNLETLVKRGESPDYQKAYALSVLGCM